MLRLSGFDAQMIYLDSPNSPFVTFKAMVYEPVDPARAPGIDELRDFLKQGIGRLQATGLDHRVARVPFDLHHPVWVLGRPSNLDDHMHRATLPAPGNRQALCEFISDVVSRPLPPDRPLWNSWLVDGLEGGRLAWVWVIHHVVADGLAAAEMIQEIHGSRGHEAETGEAMPITEPHRRTPGPFRLLGDALVALVRSWLCDFPFYFRRYWQARAARKGRRRSDGAFYGPFMAPFTILNQPGGPGREFRYAAFSLQECKTVARALGGSINDLVLAVCSEALRRYFLQHDRLPDEPLVVLMPVGFHASGHGREIRGTAIQNNRSAIAYVPIDLRAPDLRARFHAIQRGARAAIHHVEETEGTRVENFFEFIPGTFVRLVHAVLRWRQSRHRRPLANTIISNVPGPREPLFACDGRLRMVELLSCGNLGDPSAANITVWSYVDNLSFACLFRKGTAPDPDSFVTHLLDGYRDIRALALG